ncbi:hypothetical protein PTTG_29876, partial [Puccinia triticina 1-1 BBBD Race 1]
MNRLMETIYLRQTKDVILNLPTKVEKVIIPWDLTEFFQQLTKIWQIYSEKLVHLVENLNEFLQGKQGIQRPKAVVFSSFVACLEIIEKALQEKQLGSTWLLGSLDLGRQDENLAQFQSDPNCNILLGSIQAAGVGIDLQCAQIVYVM